MVLLTLTNASNDCEYNFPIPIKVGKNAKIALIGCNFKIKEHLSEQSVGRESIVNRDPSGSIIASNNDILDGLFSKAFSRRKKEASDEGIGDILNTSNSTNESTSDKQSLLRSIRFIVHCSMIKGSYFNQYERNIIYSNLIFDPSDNSIINLDSYKPIYFAMNTDEIRFFRMKLTDQDMNTIDIDGDITYVLNIKVG